jgi:exopolysaccharide production protein ExoQ
LIAARERATLVKSMGQLVLIFGLSAIAALLAVDARRTRDVSPDLWLAVGWLVLSVSRPLARWAEPGLGELDVNPEDGSLSSAIPLAGLMAATLVTLLRRRLEWLRWIGHNKWIVAFLLFAALSVLWSDYSGVAAKRWIRGCGASLTVLLVLSNPDPVAAIAATIRRCAIILIPLSIILILFFPERGIIYEPLLYSEIPVGVTTDKNSLGRYSMIVALLVSWSLMARPRLGAALRGPMQTVVHILLLVGSLYLLFTSRSATSQACFAFGIALLTVTSLATARRHPRLLVWGLVSVVLIVPPLALLGLLVDLPSVAAGALGRDLTLTGRIFVWRDLLAVGTNPIVGAGYDSFWLGERLAWFLAEHNASSAHNGFLEIYLGMGIIGLLLLVAIVYRALRHAEHSLAVDQAYGRLRLLFVFVFLLYNISEAATLLTSPMVFLLLLVATQPPPAIEEVAVGNDAMPSSVWSTRSAISPPVGVDGERQES